MSLYGNSSGNPTLDGLTNFDGNAISLRSVPLATNIGTPNDNDIVKYDATTQRWQAEPDTGVGADAASIHGIAIRAAPPPVNDQFLIYKNPPNEWQYENISLYAKNIYSDDGIISDPIRTVNMDSNQLLFTNVSSFVHRTTLSGMTSNYQNGNNTIYTLRTEGIGLNDCLFEEQIDGTVARQVQGASTGITDYKINATLGEIEKNAPTVTSKNTAGQLFVKNVSQGMTETKIVTDLGGDLGNIQNSFSGVSGGVYWNINKTAAGIDNQVLQTTIAGGTIQLNCDDILQQDFTGNHNDINRIVNTSPTAGYVQRRFDNIPYYYIEKDATGIIKYENYALGNGSYVQNVAQRFYNTGLSGIDTNFQINNDPFTNRFNIIVPDNATNSNLQFTHNDSAFLRSKLIGGITKELVLGNPINYDIIDLVSTKGIILNSATPPKGNLLVADSVNNAYNEFGIGLDGQVLTADSTQNEGLKWSSLPAAPTTLYTGNATLTSPRTVSGGGNEIKWLDVGDFVIENASTSQAHSIRVSSTKDFESTLVDSGAFYQLTESMGSANLRTVQADGLGIQSYTIEAGDGDINLTANADVNISGALMDINTTSLTRSGSAPNNSLLVGNSTSFEPLAGGANNTFLQINGSGNMVWASSPNTNIFNSNGTLTANRLLSGGVGPQYSLSLDYSDLIFNYNVADTKRLYFKGSGPVGDMAIGWDFNLGTHTIDNVSAVANKSVDIMPSATGLASIVLGGSSTTTSQLLAGDIGTKPLRLLASSINLDGNITKNGSSPLGSILIGTGSSYNSKSIGSANQLLKSVGGDAVWSDGTLADFDQTFSGTTRYINVQAGAQLSIEGGGASLQFTNTTGTNISGGFKAVGAESANNILLGNGTNLVAAGNVKLDAASTVFGNGASAGATNGLSIGSSAVGSGNSSTVIGHAAVDNANSSGTILGSFASVSAGNGVAIGSGSRAGFNCVAIGTTSTTTIPRANQIIIGTGISGFSSPSTDGDVQFQKIDNALPGSKMRFWNQVVSDQTWVSGGISLAGIDNSGNIVRATGANLASVYTPACSGDWINLGAPYTVTVLLAGTYYRVNPGVFALTSNNGQFLSPKFDTPSAGVIRYLGPGPRLFKISGVYSMAVSNSGEVHRFQLWKNGASAGNYTYGMTFPGNTEYCPISFSMSILLTTNDTISLAVTNISSAAKIVYVNSLNLSITGTQTDY